MKGLRPITANRSVINWLSSEDDLIDEGIETLFGLLDRFVKLMFGR